MCYFYTQISVTVRFKVNLTNGGNALKFQGRLTFVKKNQNMMNNEHIEKNSKYSITTCIYQHFVIQQFQYSN